MAASPEDVVNISLDLIGYQRSIGDLTEGTRASRVALRLYGQVRDETLRSRDWPFARRSKTLSLIKSAGTPLYGGSGWTTAYPLPPWLYEYTYPSDCLLLRYVRSSPSTIPALDPQPVLFTVGSDTAQLNANNQASKVILTNQVNAIAVYTGQVLDPNTWEALFTDALTQALAKKFAVALMKSPDLLKDKIAEAEQSLQAADDREE